MEAILRAAVSGVRPVVPRRCDDLFELVEPQSLREAISARPDDAAVRPIAGGPPDADDEDRRFRPTRLVSLRAIENSRAPPPRTAN
jgi:hypothetical protein